MSRVMRVAALGVCVAAALFWIWPTEKARSPTGRQSRVAQVRSTAVIGSAPDLRVSIEALEASADRPSAVSRDPFKFSVRPAASHVKGVGETPEIQHISILPVENVGPPEPLIPWKLTLTLQRGSTRWAVFSDCRGIPVTVRQGDALAGAWRVVNVGVESATLRSLDDRVTTLPLGGCAEQ